MVWLTQSTAGCDETSLTVNTKGDPSYTFTATVSGSWYKLSPSGSTSAFGKVGTSFLIYFTANTGSETRTGSVTVTYSNGWSNTLNFSQLGHSSTSSYDRMWGEQPDYVSGSTYLYKTYYTTLSSGKNVRNYSICYDTSKKVSRWVAYPVHSVYMSGREYPVGTSTKGRTDAWAYEDAITEYSSSYPYYKITGYASNPPVISQSDQQYVEDTYGVGKYNRGHMLPSASRYNTWQTNAQTFYAVNMMPQNGPLNSGSWGTVENGVRNNACSDTLYVVVGTLFENSTTFNDRKGHKVSVPSHVFKIMLRTKKGNTGKSIADLKSASDFKSIGFLFENTGNSPVENAVVSVAEIEKRSGFKFFRNLPEEIADQVKSQKNLSDWNF